MIERLGLFLLLVLLSGVAMADDFVGQASVVDGNTLEVHGTRIRLWGVDAPESSQSALPRRGQLAVSLWRRSGE